MRRTELEPAEGRHVFSGYYDKSPFDSGNTRHLALQTDFLDRLPNGGDVAEVGYFDLHDGTFHRLAETNCFNWQQGAMLQWLGPDYLSRVIFNRRVGEQFQSCILNLSIGGSRNLPMPIYAVRPQGDKALGIDFARHYWCRRAYAYGGIEDKARDLPIVPGDGVFLMDLETGATETVVALEALLSIKPVPSMNGATHYLEHIMFSANGTRFLFYHRWKSASGGIFARLYVADLDDRTPRLVLDSGRLSHACWVDDESILAWAAPDTKLGAFRKSRLVKGQLGKILRPIYRALVSGNPKFGQTAISRTLNGDSYLLIRTGTRSEPARPVCVRTLDRDGHPTAFRTLPGIMVTDTYPDLEHRARVILANYETGETVEIDTVASIPELDNTPVRCDLHPKLSFDESLVSIDTVNEGHRAIYVYDIASLAQSIR